MKVLIAKPHLLERARPEVLDQDVSPGNEFVEQPASFRMLEIERDALLIPVDAEEVGAFTFNKRGGPRRACRRRRLDVQS